MEGKRTTDISAKAVAPGAASRGLAGVPVRLMRRAQRHLPEDSFLMLLAVIAGVIIGAMAMCMHWSINEVTVAVTESGPWNKWYLFFLFSPVLGFALCYLFCKYVVKQDLECGTQKIKQALVSGKIYMPFRTMFSPIIACATTLGFGGSAGAEGPIALAGAGMGSSLAQYFRLQPQQVRILLCAGAGAGIAAIFKSPIGGFFFALEVLRMEVTALSIATLVAGCLSAWAMSVVISGEPLQVVFPDAVPFESSMLLPLLFLSIFCGLYSSYYSWLMDRTESVVSRVANPWVKIAAGGLCMGALLLLFPDLYAEGYPTMIKALCGKIAMIDQGSPLSHVSGVNAVIAVCLGMLAVKSFATSITNRCGGVGGEFTPTLFAGALAGAVFSLGCNTWFGTEFPEGDFALYGMAGVMASAVRAPLMSMFIVVEMCGDFTLFMPIVICATLSYLTTRLVTKCWSLRQSPAWHHLF